MKFQSKFRMGPIQSNLRIQIRSMKKLIAPILFFAAVLLVVSCSKNGSDLPDTDNPQLPVFKYKAVTVTVTRMDYMGKGDEFVTVYYDVKNTASTAFMEEIELKISIKTKDGSTFVETGSSLWNDKLVGNGIYSNSEIISVSTAKEIDLSTLKIEFIAVAD